ncbi:MAG: glycosyltransferase family 4 protein [Akkermansia sp.]|nr:glycosyltransferase family 4 protein [Akkermansia sp.]
MQSPKKVIAIAAEFPLFWVNPAYTRRGWYYAVWLVSLYEAFARMPEYEVHWIVFQRKAWRRSVFTAGGQTFHVLPTIQGNVAQALHYRLDGYTMARELDRIRPDIVHAWGTETRYAVTVAAYRGAVKKMLSMQGILTAYLARGPMAPYYSRQVRFEVPSMAAYDMVTAESPWGCNRCREMLPQGRIEQWEYAANPRFFAVERGLSEQPTCLLAGTSIPMKNVETAIAAFRSPELAGVTLLLAGTPAGQFADLPPNVKPLGGVDRAEMERLLASCWCLLHPSLADTSPNIVKEARVVGVPAVVSTECGGTQYVEEGKSGFIVEPRDVQGIIRGVSHLTRDAETALAMGAWGREACRRALSEETMVRCLRELYAEL